MAINPPSDLVMDVARAADPQAYRMAAESAVRIRDHGGIHWGSHNGGTRRRWWTDAG